MERITVRTLKPGESLNGPLYDRRKKLLLAQGNRLTHEMVASLVRSGVEHVYLGEWNASDILKYETAQPLSDYRQIAERFAEVLQAQVDKSLSEEVELDVAPTGEALEERVDSSLQTDRTEQRLKEWHAARDEGVQFAQRIVRGEVGEDFVADEATAVVGKVMGAFQADRSLLINLTNLKSGGDYLYTHSMNVAVLSMNIATAMQYNANQVHDIGVAALLQDLGMAMVPEQIVNAPRVLSPVEFVDIQKHAVLALYAVERMQGLPSTTRYVVYQNHERPDGTGYPRRRDRQMIHRYASIAAVADVYDALTSHRPWRRAYHPYRAMEQMIRQASKGRFDPKVVRGLLKCLSLYPLGSLVRLSTGEIAKVVHSNGDAIDRPVVSVLRGAEGNFVPEPYTINLIEEDRVSVADIVEGDEGVELEDGF
ncbi:MAG: HD-GYP domain-containing protein [Candidatus Hydrogenedentes bacterium]|nr:HD-GYP domain-containing protein [Candidatus Hydrogenedentota bacterium]